MTDLPACCQQALLDGISAKEHVILAHTVEEPDDGSLFTVEPTPKPRERY